MSDHSVVITDLNLKVKPPRKGKFMSTGKQMRNLKMKLEQHGLSSKLVTLTTKSVEQNWNFFTKKNKWQIESTADYPNAKEANEEKATSVQLGETITKSQELEKNQRPEENRETKLAESTQ